MQTEGAPLPRENFAKEISGLLKLFIAIFLFISMYSYNPGDPTFNQAVSSSWKVKNLVGPFGSYAAGLLVEMFGLGSWIIPFYCLYIGLCSFISRIRLPWWRWTGLVLLYTCFMAWASHPWLVDFQSGLAINQGGFIGKIISKWSFHYLKPVGAFLFWLFMTLAGIQFTLNLSWVAITKRLRSIFLDIWYKNTERLDRKIKRIKTDLDQKKIQKSAEKKQKEESKDDKKIVSIDSKRKVKKKDDEEDVVLLLEPFKDGPTKVKKAESEEPKKKKVKAPTFADFPVLDMLTEPKVTGVPVDQKQLEAKADSLVACLKDFNIDGEMHKVIPGPVVTMFEFKPAPGVKVSKIAGLTDDIALALRATAVRIEAPIPGKDSVGIEIPNNQRQVVYLREIFEDKSFSGAKSPLTLAIGKDIQGAPVCADLSKMPHLLVAGATGAGKSVCLNGMLMSFLYKASPDQVKLLLIDPKRIELAVYSDLPHLVHPVVTDMAMAKSALEWAVAEMDKRYENMARLGVRNIQSYNEKLEKKGQNLPENLSDLEVMPYLVIVVDELADLMMTAGKDVEFSIVRLAQLARAAGIHIIIATQRPSVDVVTGLIKANFPTRISFQVTSKHDSRTILDMVGAEKLLGRGDMLFKPSGSKLRRLHGALVEDDEIQAVVEFWKDRVPQQFDIDFSDWKENSNGGVNGDGAVGESDDPVYNEAVQFVMSQGKASISLLQRRFRIGFNRAARFIEQMEQDGILGPQEGSKPRNVLVNKD